MIYNNYLIHLKNETNKIEKTTYGIIIEIKDGCALIKNLKKAFIGEKLLIVGVSGIASVISIKNNGDIYALVYANIEEIKQDTLVIKTNTQVSINIFSDMFGRFIRPS